MTEPAGSSESVPLSTRLFVLLRMLQFAVIVMVFFYVLLGELLRRNRIADVSGILPVIGVCAALEAAGAIYLMRTKIAHLEPALRADPEDRALLISARKWYVVALAFCAGISLYGFALRIMGAIFWQAAIFYAAGIALALYCSPKKP